MTALTYNGPEMDSDADAHIYEDGEFRAAIYDRAGTRAALRTAQLFAAAPELAEALEDALRLLEHLAEQGIIDDSGNEKARTALSAAGVTR